MNRALTSLAEDLESADAPPTGPDREVLTSCREALRRFEPRWQ